MPSTAPFHLPLGDTLLAEAEVRFHVTDRVAAIWVGGPSGLVPGRLTLTHRHLYLRPVLGQPHPQERDVPLEIVRAVQAEPKRWLGVIPRPGARLNVLVTWAQGDVDHRFELDDAMGVAAQVQAALDSFGTLCVDRLVDAAVWRELDLEVEAIWGPEDYEEGEGSEHAGRLGQIRRVMRATNAALPQDTPKRFYAFTPDLPRWDFQEPCWL